MLKEYTCRENYSSKSDTKLYPIWRHSKKPEHQCYQRGREKNHVREYRRYAKGDEYQYFLSEIFYRHSDVYNTIVQRTK